MPSETIAIANALNASRIAKLQLEVLIEQVKFSQGYLAYYQQQRQFYRDIFQYSIETAIRNLTLSSTFTPNYVAQYATAFNFSNDLQVRFAQLILGRNGASPQSSYYSRRGHMYSLPGFIDTQLINYVSQAISVHRVDLFSHLYRHQEYKETIYNQRRYERFSAIATFSNKISVNVAQEGTSSFAYLNQALEAKGNVYGAAANDLFAASGNAFQSGAKRFSFPDKATKNTSMPEQYSKKIESDVKSPTWNVPNGIGPSFKGPR